MTESFADWSTAELEAEFAATLATNPSTADAGFWRSQLIANELADRADNRED